MSNRGEGVKGTAVCPGTPFAECAAEAVKQKKADDKKTAVAPPEKSS